MKCLTALILLLLLIAVPVQAVTEQCPDGGTKTESVVDGDLDNIVLSAGTLFCVKASNQASDVLTADGVKTLLDYVTWLNDQGERPNVSNYVVYQPTTTSSTTTTGSTTTTSTTATTSTTTTTVQETTTTGLTTTTTGQTFTTAAVTTIPSDTTTTTATTLGTTTQVGTPRQLPFTGFDPALFTGVALMLGSTGAFLVRRSRRD